VPDRRAAPPGETDLGRSLFSLDPQVTYLNHGSFGAVPISVQRTQLRLRDEMDANPMAFFTRGLADRFAHARRQVATFLGADPDGTAFVPNATTGSQIVLASLDLPPEAEILLTNHGYGTVRSAVERLGARAGITINEVDISLNADDDEVVAILVAAVRPGTTRFAVVDQVAAPTAKLFPVARIVAELRERGVSVLVDGAHAPGMLPLDVSATGADFWVGNLHKWAFAPRPSAVLVVSPDRRHRIEPLVVSWEHLAGYPLAVEYSGTLDYTAWLAAPTGLDLLRTIGLDRVRRHNADLAAYGQRVLAAALGVDPAHVPDPSAKVSMRLVPLPAGVADDIASAMDLRTRLAVDLGFEVALSLWNGHGYLRVSAQIYNRTSDYDRLAEALPGLLGSLRPTVQLGPSSMA